MSSDPHSTATIVLDRHWHHHDLDLVSPQRRLALTAAERTRSRYPFVAEDGTPVWLQLPRGTILQDGDLLSTATDDCVVEVVAKPEPVLTITSSNELNLLRAAYHLGNRHVSLEIAPTYLRLSPDSVLEDMLRQLGLNIVAEVAPFCPERGAYHQHHHSHSH